MPAQSDVPRRARPAMTCAALIKRRRTGLSLSGDQIALNGTISASSTSGRIPTPGMPRATHPPDTRLIHDRKSGEYGQIVLVRVGIGGREIINKTNKHKT